MGDYAKEVVSGWSLHEETMFVMTASSHLCDNEALSPIVGDEDLFWDVMAVYGDE